MWACPAILCFEFFSVVRYVYLGHIVTRPRYFVSVLRKKLLSSNCFCGYLFAGSFPISFCQYCFKLSLICCHIGQKVFSDLLPDQQQLLMVTVGTALREIGYEIQVSHLVELCIYMPASRSLFCCCCFI